MGTITEYRHSPPPDGGMDTRRTIMFGVMIILLAFGGFGTWAALAPLSSAAVAPGEIAVTSYRKTVQHLDGGIIGELLVTEGSDVESGEVLVRLDDTRQRAIVALLMGEYHEALARAARFTAERDGRTEIAFPEELLSGSDHSVFGPSLRDAMRGQETIFTTRWRALQGQSSILAQKAEQYRKEIEALSAQVKAEHRQLELIALETKDVKYLVDKGLEKKSRLLNLQRVAAQIEGERGKHLAMIARAQQSIAGAELEIISLRSERQKEVAQELASVQAQTYDIRERLLAANDTLVRTVVRAPQSGTVVGMRFHTEGGVVAPGEAILDIVPRNDRLLVEARVRPEDIDVVHAGLPAQIRLTAFSQRRTRPISGKVVLVSADRVRADGPEDSYYGARIELDPASLAGLPDGNVLYPGMPAEAIIVTGERTALDYLLDPLTRMVGRALRED